MDLPDPWELHRITGAPEKEDLEREQYEMEQEELNRPIEGVKCLVCGGETVHPILEVIDITQGGAHVGYLCSGCSRKYTGERTP